MAEVWNTKQRQVDNELVMSGTFEKEIYGVDETAQQVDTVYALATCTQASVN